MAETDLQEKVISRKNQGFPEWLDFDKLRTEGIDYLGELSGKIWTDHNVHDPGITILEMLCYALLDLGYRTSLPAKDLFSRNPLDTGVDDNFFTPAQILGCNPLTITDYRKLLVDIKGVKNAWLTVAEDINIGKICNRQWPPSQYHEYERSKEDCTHFLNGLYHVYIDLDDEVANRNDDAEKKEVVKSVRKTLMAHRNLCEDFYDITILCKQKLGVCADLEIESNADAGQVFLSVIEKLRDFISPSPRFYRLKQLLEEKGRSIEDIFAGRPIDLTESYGFIDVEEFENIVLRKEIHLSDVYNEIFSIPGVAAIRNLRLQNCDGSLCAERVVSDWIFKLFENHVPQFSLDCSGFHFTRDGVEMIIDRQQYKQYLDLNFSNSGKTLSKKPADFDMPVPVGLYREDLNAYFPLENDFPKIYGIAEGSLPDNVSNARKAQSLQLRGYLLFFDHLLSGYLSQLKNIRSLFALQPGSGERHTYPVNRLTNWPGLEKLLRFDINEDKTASSSGIRAFPVSRQKLEEIFAPGNTIECDFQKGLDPYLFCSAAERDIAIHTLMADAADGTIEGKLVTTATGCWFFYLLASSSSFAIISRGEYKTEKSARDAMKSIRFLAETRKNYRPYISNNSFSFSLTAGITGYWNYLQSLTENEQLYRKRRTVFLDHLLARFAETFTDFALLSYSFLSGEDLLKNNISNKEKFLSAYPDLSSNRGRGYDYSINGWNNTNVPGFEKKALAYAGSAEAKQENLCHFEVTEYEEESAVLFGWNNNAFFKSDQSFDNREEGKLAVQQLLKALPDKNNYTVEHTSLKDNYTIKLKTEGISFSYPQSFDEQEKAEKAIDLFRRMFSTEPLSGDIQPVSFRHDIVIEKKQGEQSWRRKTPVINTDPELKIDETVIADFPGEKNWTILSGENTGEDIAIKPHPDNPAALVNMNAFDHIPNRVDIIEGKVICQFTLNDLSNNFFFISERGYEAGEAAEKALRRFIFLLTDEKNYDKQESGSVYYIKIVAEGKVIATNTMECNTTDEVREKIQFIKDYVSNQVYTIKADTQAVQWRYDLRLGLPATHEFVFTGSRNYDKYDDLVTASRSIADPSKHYEVIANKNGELEIRDKKQELVAKYVAEEPGADIKKLETEAKELLEIKKMITQVNRPGAAELEAMVVPDNISRQGNFGYRLVKKDDYHAWHSLDKAPADKAEKSQVTREFHKFYIDNYYFLEICYGGDGIIEKNETATGNTEYHYVVRSRSHAHSPGEEMVLFKSIVAYASAEEAQNAFDTQYVGILTAASDSKNYGTIIGFEEIVVRNNECRDIREKLVFIPAATMKLFGYNHQYAAENLSKLAAAYPIKAIKKSDPLFTEYFGCKNDDKEPADPKDDCGCGYTWCHDTEKDFYYFQLSYEAGKNGWTSYQYFNTPSEALKHFHFFLLLLPYRGNYHVGYNECDCTQRLYIREILAVSKRRFRNEREAWDGIDKFICVSQSENSFHAFHQETTCCYTFNIACGNMGLIHPCSYDTARKRDKALKKLITATGEWVKKIKSGELEKYWVSMMTEWNAISPVKKQRSSCDMILNMIQDIAGYTGDIPASQFEKFKKFAGEFPFTRKQNAAGTYKYYLNINLPGFCEEANDKVYDPCGCEKNKDDNDTGCSCCCTAWISECCFDTCNEAWIYLNNVADCLLDEKNYYPVFDCECGPYGIRFYCNCESTRRQENPNDPALNYDRQQFHQSEDIHCCNEIVAYNPQCYAHPKMVCEAIKRAKGLINAEGLHLAEHILLRPHCVDDNGDCNCLIDICDEITKCRFEWKLPPDDPCTKDKSWCFVPGLDPYSFIATAVLPAWPERFRKKENRQLMEQLLYRELPAHILLRVLWLSPHDLCRFETLYHNWTRWLAGKPVCGEHNAPCELIDFLFEHKDPETGRGYPFECFDCEECIPCEETGHPADPCIGVTITDTDPNRYVNTINELFCWPQICPRVQLIDVSNIRTITDETAIDAERKLDERFYNYKERVDRIVEASGNINAKAAHSFLLQETADFAAYHDTVEQIIANKRSDENTRVLSMDEKRTLIKYVTWHYLDKAIMQDSLNDFKSEIKEVFKKLEKRELKPEYKDWKGTVLTELRPDLHLREIKKLFE